MTCRYSARGKRVETDYHQTNPIISACCPKHTTLINDSPNPKLPKVCPQRRQSQRLRAINATYKMEDTVSLDLELTSPENSPCGSKQIKVESIDALDDPSISETLKDLRQRCRAKKRKVAKSFGTSNADLNHALLKPNEEEPDLDELLICLKLKKLNKSSASRKRRKCSLFQESSQVEEIFGSSPTESDRSSILKEVACGTESLSTTESVNDNMEVEICNAVNSCEIIIDSCNNLGGSSTELSQRVCEGELANSELYSSTEKFLHPCVINHNSSPPTVSQIGASPVVDISQPVVNKVKSEAIEINSLESKLTNDVSSSSHVEFIAKFSSDELHERNGGGESKIEDATTFAADPLGCCVNEISVEFEETDNCTSVPKGCKEHFGEKINIECSEISCHNLSSFSDSKPPTHCAVPLQLVSETTDLIFDVYGRARNFDIALEEVIYGSIRNHLHNLESTQECPLIDNNMEPRMTKEPSPMPSTCSNKNNATAERSLHSRDFHFCHTSGFSEEVGSLDSLVLKALRGDPWRNSNGDHANFHIEKSSIAGTYDLCSLQHSNMITNSSCSLRDSNEISPAKENLHCSSIDHTLNDHVEKAADSSEIDRAEYINSNIEMSCFKRTYDLSVPAAEKKSHTTGDKPTYPSNKSNLVEGEESNMKNEVKSDQEIEYHPKKLLSNRKDLSPMSQEKLRQALSSSELDDTKKSANYGEAEVMLSPERMTKKSKSSRNGFVQQLSKGVLKSHITPVRNCSCTNNSFIHTQAQKAVTFSQRQMQDIETIATKLLKGLASMKNIVMENVGSEACLSTPSKFTPEEVNIAIDNASNLEATTKKWLSMMAKDCNRFCKIMKPIENMEVTPVSVRKQPKKITFADEAGGLLCQVKVFEQLPETHI